MSLRPAFLARDPESSRLNAIAANRTGLWIDQGQQRIVAKIGNALEEHGLTKPGEVLAADARGFTRIKTAWIFLNLDPR